nr:family 20 glycosylhydrolase [Mariniflexile sp.]
QETWGVFDDVFCAGNEKTFEFLENVLNEVIPLFPSEYIHIGGDECPKSNWKRCSNCQKRIQENQLADEHELQSYFIQRIEKYLNAKGKKIIGWDEILEGGLAPNATVMSWRGEKGGIEAAKQHHDVIMTPGTHCYFDKYQVDTKDQAKEPLAIGGFLSIEKVYNYNPIPDELAPDEKKYVLGAQGNVWTEYMKTTDYVEYMILPRMTALSEAVWSPFETKNWNGFKARLNTMKLRYEALGLKYAPHVFKTE